LDPTPGMRTEKGKTAETSFPNPFPLAPDPFIIENNKVEEKEEQIEPPPNSNMSNDKEVSTKSHSFVTIPLKTHNEPQASPFQCLEEPSYVEIFKESSTQRCKFRNRSPKKILLSNKVCYIRSQNILPEGYQILKKKGWKGLVGHPHDRGRRDILSILFFTLYF
jgi:hypothetical protein